MAGLASKVTDYFFKSVTAPPKRNKMGDNAMPDQMEMEMLMQEASSDEYGARARSVWGKHPPPAYDRRSLTSPAPRPAGYDEEASAGDGGGGEGADHGVDTVDEKCRKALMKHMSPAAYAVVAYSSKVLSTSVEKLQTEFEERVFNSELISMKQQYYSNAANYLYDRCFVEFAFFKAIASWSPYEYSNLLDPNFHRYTFDCMVAWETPSLLSQPTAADESTSTSTQSDPSVLKAAPHDVLLYEPQAKEQHDEDAASSLFYSDLMPILADVEDTVGSEAFVRIAPCMMLLSDSVSARPQFETLTVATKGRMPFPLYDKYLRALHKSIKDSKARNESSFLQGLALSRDECVMEIDGVSQAVIQHVGSKSTSGRLTLTNYALYFEPSSVISYKELVKLNLSSDAGHKVAPDLSGPWGTRIFDKAIAYKTSSMSEPIVWEFPEMMGSARRDYWLAIIQEVIDCHGFIRKYKLKQAGEMAVVKESEEGEEVDVGGGSSTSIRSTTTSSSSSSSSSIVCGAEAMARAILGVIRLQALKEAISHRALPSKPGALLIFNLAQGFLPWGDLILDALLRTLRDASSPASTAGGEDGSSVALPNSALQTLLRLSLLRQSPQALLASAGGYGRIVYRMRPGLPTPLEKAVMESCDSAKQTQKAKALEEDVKLDGIGINIAVLNELFRPAIALFVWLHHLCSWARPLETIHLFIFLTYIIYRDWVGYIPPIVLALAGGYVIWLRLTNKLSRYREIVVQTPPGVSLEQVVSAQRAISQIQGLLQALNLALLKIWALALSIKPEATNLMTMALFAGALVLAILPARAMAFVMLVLVFTSTFRRSNAEGKLHRRCRELWHSIPPLPVRVVGSEEEKKLQEALQS